MNVWSNIEVPHGEDAEIMSINKLQKLLGKYGDPVRDIRELITRFEVCHFKYLKHLENIWKSIMDLQPYTDPANIGQNHIQHGDKTWKSDNTGRAFMGQQYLWTLDNWLENKKKNIPHEYNVQLAGEVDSWLGIKTPEKVKLVRMLMARLKWDWKTLEKLSRKTIEEISLEKEDKRLEYQVYRMDICHLAFPLHLINVLRGIGKMKPVDNFEGCGKCNPSVKKSILTELIKINRWLLPREEASITIHKQEDLFRIWLFASLAKTIKEQAGLKSPIHLPADIR